MESPLFLRIRPKCHNILNTILRGALKATINLKKRNIMDSSDLYLAVWRNATISMPTMDKPNCYYKIYVLKVTTKF